MEFSLEPIIEYDFSDLESQAYKVCVLWISLSRKVFPEYKHGTGLPKKGDPRKCQLFKYAYKLIRESQGVIKPEDLSLYIKSQLDMLKAITQQSDFPFIGPQILVGDKAWIRWKMWKRQYDAISKRQTLDEANLDMIPFEAVKKGLEETKQFLIGKFEGEPKEEQIMMGHVDMSRWVGLGKVSPFYAILSPWVKKYVKIVNLDPLVYEKSVTQDVIDLFKNLFHYETSKAGSQ
jgi:hypothetical protein